MQIIIINKGETTKTDLEVNDLKSVLSLIKLNYGAGLFNEIRENSFKYILNKSTDLENPLALDPALIMQSFGDYDQLYIVEPIEGEAVGGVIVAAVAGAAAAATTAGLIAAAIINTIISVAISVALSAIMNAISPTPEFSGDPAFKQKTSNLFNGPLLTQEQGGIVPYIFGHCFTGAVVISAGISTKDE